MRPAEVRVPAGNPVFSPWSTSGHTPALSLVDARGCWFWDDEGNRYLDLASQLVNVNAGHQHPRIVEAVVEQARRLCTAAPTFGNDARTRLAGLIVDRAPGDAEKVFFTNGGAEANEHALRMARLATGRHKVLAAYRSYHGATAGAISLTGDPRRWRSEPGAPGVVHFSGPYAYRSSFHARDEAEEGERALAHLREVLGYEGPHTVAAIFLEPVVGTNGVLVPPPGYLRGVRELCDEHGVLLVCDEVMTGFGRLGEWFAVDLWDVRPDLITFAKGVTSGYVPLGGVVVSSGVASAFAETPYPGGLTYSGHPLACAAGVASVELMEELDVLGHVRRLGRDVLGPALHRLAERHPSVGEVRGTGLMWALELVTDRRTRQPLVPFHAKGSAAEPMRAVAQACVAGGVWPFVQENRLHVTPPLVITEEELQHALEVVDEALKVADTHVTA